LGAHCRGTIEQYLFLPFLFFNLQLFFEDTIDDAKYCGRLYGLGTGVAQKQNEDVDSAQEKMSILAIINNMQP